jgi:hypothetical protein
MQLPDTLEPNSNGAGRLFLNAFNRGDRDLNPRRTDGTILQGLTMMNNTFVTSRMHRANAGSRVQTLLAQTSDPETIIQTLFKSTLSRPATSQELSMFMTMFQQQGNITAAENLQWVLLNKLQFLFNY